MFGSKVQRSTTDPRVARESRVATSLVEACTASTMQVKSPGGTAHPVLGLSVETLSWKDAAQCVAKSPVKACTAPIMQVKSPGGPAHPVLGLSAGMEGAMQRG
jgi:hypothetical protein